MEEVFRSTLLVMVQRESEEENVLYCVSAESLVLSHELVQNLSVADEEFCIKSQKYILLFRSMFFIYDYLIHELYINYSHLYPLGL